MMQVVPMDGAANSIGGHRFVINLICKENEPAEVRSCEVIGPRHRNRFSFPSCVSVAEVFVDDLARGITQCLGSLSQTTEVVSLPTMAIEVPGLSLAKAHLITTKDNDGTLAIILRFKTFLGRAANGFRPELGIEDSVSDHTGHMSAMVLTDIVMPLLDMCSVAETSGLNGSRDFDEFMDTLIERSAEMRFQAELIKRFVASSDQSDTRRQLRSNGRPKIELVGPR